MKLDVLVRPAALAAALLLAACGGGGGDAGSGGAVLPSGQGTLRVAITDTPACGYDEVNVTVQKVRVHQSAGAGDGDAGWAELVVQPPRRIDLTNLTNGVLEELGQATLPAGRYTQLRLVLAENGASAPFANSVRPSGGGEVALTTPSGAQSGLKVNADIDVPADRRADVVIDFDACRSVVRRGNSGQYNLKPVLRVVPRLSDAGMRVVGHLGAALAASTTTVSLQLAGVPVKSTLPDGSGQFVLYPVPPGVYDLVVTAPGRATAVVGGVPVVTTAVTNVNTATARIVPPLAGGTRTVAGTVTPATATVRALQSLSGGPTVEVAWAAVDAASGAFATTLPLDAPVRAAYAANAAALTFTADAAAAGRYTVEATAAGSVKTQAVDVAAPVPALSFVFP